MEIPYRRLRTWLFRDALPFWEEHGVGGPVAFHETLTLDGAPGPGTSRRVRTIARQTYVFSQIAISGREKEGLRLARRGVEALIARAWQGPDKGWARLLDANGDVLDPRPDLYDFAFVLFALGWFMQASGDRGAEPYANATLDLIERTMRHPSGRGHLHILPPETPHQQNPHMHLLEACLAMDAGAGDPRWMEKAEELFALFGNRFFDPETGDLTEYFDADWRPAPGEQGRVVEPGHQLEWAWILARYGARAGVDVTHLVRGLVEAAEARGVSAKSGLVHACVSKDGALLNDRHRIWPQTERMKGNLALFELTGEDRSAPIATAANALLDRYLAPAPAGAWIDTIGEDGAHLSTDIPASTLYHLALAFAETLRLQPAQETRA